MSSLAPSLEGQNSDGTLALKAELTPDSLKRRVRRRRQMLIIQAGSYALNSLVLLIYAYARRDCRSPSPSSYFLSGLLLTVACLPCCRKPISTTGSRITISPPPRSPPTSRSARLPAGRARDRLCLLSSLFLAFGFGALRMTSRQAVIAWTLHRDRRDPGRSCSADDPDRHAADTPLERLAAMLSFVITIGAVRVRRAVRLQPAHHPLQPQRRAASGAYQRIEELAELDELTGSFNRRCIMRMLEDEIARSRRSQDALLGRPDRPRLVQAHQRRLRPPDRRRGAADVRHHRLSPISAAIDKFGRYGGEEFLLVLPDTSDEAAQRSLDRLRAIVAELDWSAMSRA